MKRLTIQQEGIGALDLTTDIPAALRKHVLDTAVPIHLQGEGFNALFQLLVGKGFQVWLSQYWMTAPTILKAQGDLSVLELRISLRNQIKGTWDKMLQPALPEYYYQLGFVPGVVTRAIFDATPGIDMEYQTLDVHVELSFLETIGVDYKIFEQFIQLILEDQPAELSPAPRRCPPLMIEAIQAILSNNYSKAGKERLLQNCVENIILAALEDADRDGTILPYITPVQQEALEEVKRIIEASGVYYPGSKWLCKKTGLNLCILNLGFKRLFNYTPKQYHTILRFEIGKALLRQGDSINSVSSTLDYDSPRAFGKAFKTHFGLTPKEYQLSFRK